MDPRYDTCEHVPGKKTKAGWIFCKKCGLNVTSNKSASESVNVKRKKYLVDVRSHVSAKMTVFANSKTEAWEIAETDMKVSLKRQLENAVPNEMLSDLDGWAEAMKSSVQII